MKTLKCQTVGDQYKPDNKSFYIQQDSKTKKVVVKMKTFEKYIQKYLTKLGYKQITKCKNDLVNTLKVYKCLGMALYFISKATDYYNQFFKM